MLAATKPNLNVIKILIQSGSKTHLQNKDGWTPFHIACREGHSEIITFFLSVDDKVWNTRSKNGRTPLHTSGKMFFFFENGKFNF